MNRWIILLSLTLTYAGTFGQPHSRVWFKGGVNLSGTTYDLNFQQSPDFITTTSTTMKVSYFVGLAVDIRFGELSLRPELLYTVLESEWSQVSDNYNYNPPIMSNYSTTRSESRRYVTVPVQLVYHFREVPSFEIGFGGYVSQGLTGYFVHKETNKDLSPPHQVFNIHQEGKLLADTDPNGSYDSPYYNPLDAGLTASIGYEFKQILISIQYTYGMVNTLPYYEHNVFPRGTRESMNRNFAIGVSFRIIN